MFWFSLQRLSETFLILRRTEPDMIKTVYRSACKVPLFLLDVNPLNAELNPTCHLLALLGAHHILHVSRIRVNETWILMTLSREMLKWEISCKSFYWEPSCSLRSDGWTDRHRHDEADCRLSQFCETAWWLDIICCCLCHHDDPASFVEI